MSQSDVLEVLEKYKKPLSRTEIANILGYEPYKISVSINKLLKIGEITCIELRRQAAFARYNVNHRMRIYKCKEKRGKV